jgi:hypothetical protein
MKMPILYPLFMLMLVIFMTAACIGEDTGFAARGTVAPGISPVSPGTTVTPANTIIPQTTTTALPSKNTLSPRSPVILPSVELSALAINQHDLPQFVVVDKREFPVEYSGSKESDAVSEYQQILSLTGKSGSDTYPSLAQSITEYPPDNATVDFLNMEQSFKEERNDPGNRQTWLEDPKIGDQSFAISETGPRESTTAGLIIAFRKANIVEVISLMGSEKDLEILKESANAAAMKVPSTGIQIPSSVVPVVSKLTLEGPVNITPSGTNSIEKITFNLELKPGNNHVDLSQTEYTIGTPTNSLTVRYGDPIIRTTWKTVQGESNTILEPGGIVMIELNTGTIDTGLKSPETGNRLSLRIRPSTGAALSKSCVLPSSMTPGRTIECD